VDSSGKAKYITMGFKTFWDATPGEIMNTHVIFISAAYDIKEGHSLALVMDTNNPEYGKPTFTPFDVNVHYNSDISQQSVLKITQKK